MTVASFVATPGGAWLVLAVLVPVAGMLASFALGGRNAERVALIGMGVSLVVAVIIARQVVASGAPLAYALGGYAPPLGIALRADGVSVVMLVTAALIMPAAGFYARANFATPAGQVEARAPFAFWILVQAIAAALNLLFLSSDLFNLYVGLELLTFAAVPLVCLDGRPETLKAALRYLVFALFGSMFYLLGVGLIYAAFGTLDFVLIAERMRATPPVWLGAGLMTAGLLAKTALFPLHLWLPPAHANAPPAASAILSGLVVKGSFVVFLRIWFFALPELQIAPATTVLAALGSAAILFGSLLALRQARLKLLIAYSTLAQIGYLFLVFPLAAGAHAWGADAWSGGLMQMIAHAFAKSAMFLAAGLVYESLGHDRIAGLTGAARAMPMTFFALGLGGLSLMGLPPSGGFAAKWLLITASIKSGQWLWAVVMLAGGLLAAGYLYRILQPAMADAAVVLKARPAKAREAIVLGLAVVAVLLGFMPASFYSLLQLGRPILAGVSP
jgi:multicomponent Na+:H+ antiporter subunit D